MGAKHNTLCVCVCVCVSAAKIKSNSHLKTFNMRFQVAHKDDPTILYNIRIYVDTVFFLKLFVLRAAVTLARRWGRGINDKHLLNGELNCCTGEPFWVWKCIFRDGLKIR